MKKTIPSLNGLRAISIFIVLFSHINIANFDGALAQHTRLLDGQFGVTVFFIISGFLITTLLINEEARTGMISLRNFYLKRVLRIFPVYFILLFVYLVLQSAGVLHFTSLSWLTSLTYTKDFKWNSDWETAHLWSLSIEEQFYLFWPLVFIYWKKHRVKFAFFVVLLSPLCRVLGMSAHAGFDEFSIFQRSDAIMWGCIFAIYHHRIFAFIQKLTAGKSWLLITPFALLLSLDVFVQANHAFNLHMGFLIVPLIGSLTGTLACIAVAAIIIVSIHYTGNPWFKLLNSRLLNYVGILSYSIYIWQQLFFSEYLGALAKGPLNIVLIFVTANCSYYLVEKPFLKLKDHLKPAGKKAPVHAGQVAMVEQIAQDGFVYEEAILK